MAHCEKYPKAAVTGMFIHYERTAGHNLSNKDIDSSRSHLNYNVAETDQSLSQYLFLSQRLSEIKTNNRNNQNVICDWIVTQPKDVRSEDSHAFFLAVYEFLSNRYGKKNVVSAYVHMDEIGQTPHMHFCFVPVQTLLWIRMNSVLSIRHFRKQSISLLVIMFQYRMVLPGNRVAIKP